MLPMLAFSDLVLCETHRAQSKGATSSDQGPPLGVNGCLLSQETSALQPVVKQGERIQAVQLFQ
jgi:hypothetical protein